MYKRSGLDARIAGELQIKRGCHQPPRSLKLGLLYFYAIPEGTASARPMVTRMALSKSPSKFVLYSQERQLCEVMRSSYMPHSLVLSRFLINYLNVHRQGNAFQDCTRQRQRQNNKLIPRLDLCWKSGCAEDKPSFIYLAFFFVMFSSRARDQKHGASCDATYGGEIMCAT
jgi:hypothetical protein